MTIIPYDHLAKSFHAKQLALATRCHAPLTTGVEMLAYTNILLQNYLAKLQVAQTNPDDKILRRLSTKTLTAREMLAAMPILNKAQLAYRRCMFPAKTPVFSFTYQDSTSGSTGKPFRVFRPAHSIQRESIRLWHMLVYYGIDPHKHPLHSVVYLSHYPRATAYQYIDHTLWPLTTFKCPFGRDTTALALPTSNGSFVLGGTPSSHMAALKITLDFPNRRPCLALSSGEDLPAEARQEMLERYRCPVVNLYVMREFGLLGFECKCGKGIHLFETDFVFSSSASDGILVTDTTNNIDFYINYATGDYGELKREGGACCCGSHLPLLIDFRGRSYGKSMLTASV